MPGAMCRRLTIVAHHAEASCMYTKMQRAESSRQVIVAVVTLRHSKQSEEQTRAPQQVPKVQGVAHELPWWPGRQQARRDGAAGQRVRHVVWGDAVRLEILLKAREGFPCRSAASA